MTGSIIMPSDDDYGIEPEEDEYGHIGTSDKQFYEGHFYNLYIDGSEVSTESDIDYLSNKIDVLENQRMIYTISERNNIYKERNLGTIASISDANDFSNFHEINTGKFLDLYLGDYITIQDGTYNKQWVIAGFDFDMWNGQETRHHLILIPYDSDFIYNESYYNNGYKNTIYNSTLLPNIANTLSGVLGDHMATHKVYMSTNMGSEGQGASAGSWESTKLALLCEMEVIGNRQYCSTQYDDGGLTIKLPIFNFKKLMNFKNFDFSVLREQYNIYNAITYRNSNGKESAFYRYISNTNNKYFRPRMMFI